MLLLASVTMPATAEMERFGSFIIDGDHPKLLILAGDIQQNAPIDLRRALRRFPDVEVLALHSAGGDVTAGLLVAQEIFDLKINTYIAPDTGCYSACAYIFFAGERREVQGELGVHQMANDVGDQYSVQVAISDMLDTMAEFDVPPAVISQMLRTAPEDMRVYSAAEAENLGLNRLGGHDSTVAVAPAPPEVAPDKKGPLNLGLPPQDLVASNSTRSFLIVDGDGSSEGSIWWSKSIDIDGLATIVAEASIPTRSMEVKVIWRKNTDTSLPTPVIMEANFAFREGDGSPAVASLAGLLAKDEFNEAGTPLIGASAKIVSNSFLFALSPDDGDATGNLVLLSDYPFLDLAFVFEDGTNALLTLQKDGSAERLFREVLESWAD